VLKFLYHGSQQATNQTVARKCCLCVQFFIQRDKLNYLRSGTEKKEVVASYEKQEEVKRKEVIYRSQAE